MKVTQNGVLPERHDPSGAEVEGLHARRAPYATGDHRALQRARLPEMSGRADAPGHGGFVFPLPGPGVRRPLAPGHNLVSQAVRTSDLGINIRRSGHVNAIVLVFSGASSPNAQDLSGHAGYLASSRAPASSARKEGDRSLWSGARTGGSGSASRPSPRRPSRWRRRHTRRCTRASSSRRSSTASTARGCLASSTRGYIRSWR